MLGKALSLAIAAALIAAAVVQARELTRVWDGQTASGGSFFFRRLGDRIGHLNVEIPVRCTYAESTKAGTEQLELARIFSIGRGGRIKTTQHPFDIPGTVTIVGTVGAKQAHGTVTWNVKPGRFRPCHGHGSMRWTATRNRPIADPL